MPLLGGEFMPTLEEGSMWVRASMPNNISFAYANQIALKRTPGHDSASAIPSRMRTSAVRNKSEKESVALISLFAVVGLTGIKLTVGLLTGSLGIVAEAAHSGLDLVAALLTFLAVRISGRPADATHLYGHGKVENLSALVETLLLLAACWWIVFEAVYRLRSHAGDVEATVWSFVVMAVSILVDASRSRALERAAKKYNSQALEADALHFRTDIWSSSVVIVGLAAVKMADWFPTLG